MSTPSEPKQDHMQKNTIIGYPTESFFALGVNATQVFAIKQLFRLKQREPGKPVALIAADIQQVKKYFYVSSPEERLLKKYWPGSVTILLKPKASIAARALGARRIGVRIPAHAGARRLAAKVGAPITATSANISGQPPTKSARKLKQDFPDILIASGRCGKQTKPSTIIELRKKTIHIIRPGAVHPIRSSFE